MKKALYSIGLALVLVVVALVIHIPNETDQYESERFEPGYEIFVDEAGTVYFSEVLLDNEHLGLWEPKNNGIKRFEVKDVKLPPNQVIVFDSRLEARIRYTGLPLRMVPCEGDTLTFKVANVQQGI